MGQFASLIFSALLGWVKTVAASLWNLLNHVDANAWFRWVVDNWLPLTVLLCIAGIIVDFIVYLIRWQPYRIWGRFLRRSSDQPDSAEENARFQRKWVYADGTTVVEDIRKTQHTAAQQTGAEPLEFPIRPVRRAPVNSSAEHSYYQPVYPPQWPQTTKDNMGGNP